MASSSNVQRVVKVSTRPGEEIAPDCPEVVNYSGDGNHSDRTASDFAPGLESRTSSTVSGTGCTSLEPGSSYIAPRAAASSADILQTTDRTCRRGCGWSIGTAGIAAFAWGLILMVGQLPWRFLLDRPKTQDLRRNEAELGPVSLTGIRWKFLQADGFSLV